MKAYKQLFDAEVKAWSPTSGYSKNNAANFQRMSSGMAAVMPADRDSRLSCCSHGPAGRLPMKTVELDRPQADGYSELCTIDIRDLSLIGPILC